MSIKHIQKKYIFIRKNLNIKRFFFSSEIFFVFLLLNRSQDVVIFFFKNTFCNVLGWMVQKQRERNKCQIKHHFYHAVDTKRKEKNEFLWIGRYIWSWWVEVEFTLSCYSKNKHFWKAWTFRTPNIEWCWYWLFATKMSWLSRPNFSILHENGGRFF